MNRCALYSLELLLSFDALSLDLGVSPPLDMPMEVLVY